ncbi:MAG: AMP-binding protein, partial [Myxococcota bacterium]
MSDRFNVATLLDRTLDAGRGTSTALICDNGQTVSHRELFDAVCRVAHRLRTLGLRREERVLLVLDDTLAFPAAFLGALRIGVVPIPANFLARAEDLGYFIDDSYATLAVIDAGFLPKLEPVLGERPALRVAIANGKARPSDLSFDAWLEDPAEELSPVDTHAEDMAFWLYSSGSTGRPKGVVHAHGDVRFSCEHYAKEVLETTPQDVHLSTTKLFHAYGLGNGLTFPLWSGASAVYLTGKPTAPKALEKIRAQRPSLVFSVPTLYNLMLQEPAFAEVDFSSVRLGVSAAEALPPEVWRQFHERTGVEILDGIGSTELLHIYCSNRKGAVKVGTS